MSNKTDWQIFTPLHQIIKQFEKIYKNVNFYTIALMEVNCVCILNLHVLIFLFMKKLI